MGTGQSAVWVALVLAVSVTYTTVEALVVLGKTDVKLWFMLTPRTKTGRIALLVAYSAFTLFALALLILAL